jgi:hypothetical protein
MYLKVKIEIVWVFGTGGGNTLSVNYKEVQPRPRMLEWKRTLYSTLAMCASMLCI